METKQRLITVMLALVAMFMGTKVMAQEVNLELVQEIDWTQQDSYYNGVWYDNSDAVLSFDNGLVIDNTSDGTGNYWEPQVPIIAKIPEISAGEYYQVKFTVDAPAAGEIRLDFCSWDGSKATMVANIDVEKGLKEYTADFINYPTSCTNAMVFYQCGKIPGKHTIKKVQVWRKVPEAYAELSNDGKTLTFRYDLNKSSYGSNAYDVNNSFPGWKTPSTLCDAVETVVFEESFKDARPTSTGSWFLGMKNLTSITGLEYLNTSEVTNMQFMFTGCEKLSEINLSGFNTSEVTDMSYMFTSCSSLETLDLSSFNTQLVTNMDYMFPWCLELTTIIVGGNWSTEQVTSSDYMFSGCTSIIGGAGTIFDENHLDKEYARVDGGTSNPGYLTAAPSEAYTVYSISNSNVKTLTFYYDNLRNTASRIGIKKYDLNEEDVEPGWISDNLYIEKVVFDSSFKDARPTTTDHWFYNLTEVESFTGLEYLNTSEVTDMNYMFFGCSSLETLTLGDNFDTSNVTAMGMMFSSCENLKTLTLGNYFDTSKVTSMQSMFSNCHNLETLNLSSFNTSNVAYMMEMFYFCENLKTITVGENWKTTNVNLSDNMFYGCTSIVGGAGTEFDENHLDKEYARIDGGEFAPGYLTILSYGITVSGKAVTIANKYDVLGNETVNYDDALNILTLINADVSSINIASTALNNLLIKVNGECEVKNELGNAFTSDIANLTIEGPGKLTIGSTRRIGIKLGHNAGLIVDDVDLIVSGSTGIEGSYIGATYKCHLGFFNANCTVTSKATSSPSVNYIFSLKLIDCIMTSGKFDRQNHMVIGNPMIIQRSGGISTDINTIDNGQLTMDKSLPLYNLNGQRVSHPVKGQIYIQNGRKIKF